MIRTNLLFQSDCNAPSDALRRFLTDVGIPGNDLVEIDNALQARFFQKGPGGEPKERWELSPVSVECPAPKFRRHLRLLGFIDETIPQRWHAKRAAWPGAMGPRAWYRLLDLISAWRSGVRWQETVVHGGKRPADVTKEGLKPMLLAMGNPEEAAPMTLDAWGEGEPDTELEVMRRTWKLAAASGMIPDDMLDVPVVWVDAPMKPNPVADKPPIRPNSEDVIRHWLQTESPEPGTLLLSSGAPYGMAQDLAYRMLLEPSGHVIETFGHACPNTLGTEALMRELAGAVNRERKLRRL